MRTELAKIPGRNGLFAALWDYVHQRTDAQTLALLIIRVDQLRELNREYGYEAADQVLFQLAFRVRDSLREGDLLFRTGNAEFGLVLPGLKSSGQATLAAMKLAEASAKPFLIGDNKIRIRTCMGVSLYPNHARDPGGLLESADRALSRNRHLEESYTVYSQADKVEPTPVLVLESELEEGIENGDIAVHFQPKIDLRSAKVAGVETLARWSSPTQGPVRPDIFVDLAEQIGFIMPLTLRTLNAALSESRDWPDLSVALNLSATILNHPELVDHVTRAMKIWGMDAGRLTLEVTESAMMTEPKRSLEVLKKFHGNGIRLSIDDFGTGYSSLAYLKQLPVDELKIDKSFVMNMVSNDGDEKIVRAVIDLAHNFDITVVAEGIENQETLETLTEMGCEYAQGFFMARPMPGSDLKTWLTDSPWGLPSPADG